MKGYSSGDIAKFYFVIIEDKDKDFTRILAYSDSKDLVDAYMQFHKSKNLKVKVYTDTIEEIYKVTNENYYDEIFIGNIIIRDPKNKRKVKRVTVPITETESNFINTETSEFMASRVNYSYLNDFIPCLKPKYQKLMTQNLLSPIIRRVVDNQSPKILEELEFDSLMVLLDSFPDQFGA